jgi:FdhD protein
MPFVYRLNRGRVEGRAVPVVRERPLTVFVNGAELATLLCSPNELEALVVGFLYFEGVIDALEDLEELRLEEAEGWAEVRVARPFRPRRRIFTSGCTGGVTFSLDYAPPLDSALRLEAERLYPLLHQMYERAALYQASRGIHAAALADAEAVLLVAEDVGRHNAVDKIQGLALLRGIETADRLLLSSGRISSEMLRKGAKMRTPLIASRTSPTELAIEWAKRLGIALIGYVRPDSFNLYSHPERLLLPSRKPAAVGARATGEATGA